MKKLSVLLLFCTMALAQPKPENIPNIYGFIITGIKERIPFSVTGGSYGECTKKNVLTNWTQFKCPLSGSSMKTEDNTVYQFERAVVNYRIWQDRPIREIFLFGTHKEVKDNVVIESPTSLNFWNYESEPQKYRGVFSLKDLGLSYAVRATIPNK